MNQPLVSVIMSSYNPREEWLFDAIESLRSQTMADWELVLWDDGSDADCATLLRQAAALDSRIRLVTGEKNRGLAYGLNRCLELAVGGLIARMDDDDLSDPRRFELQVRFLMEHPEFDWLGTTAMLFDDRGIWGIHTAQPEPLSADYLPYSPYIHPSVMFRAESLRRAGGYMDLPLTRRCEDYELFMRMHGMGMRGYNLQQELLYYREDRDHLTKRSFLGCAREMIVRIRGFSSLRIGFLRAAPSAVKPLLVWIVSRFPRIAQMLRRCCSGGIRETPFDGSDEENDG